MDFIIVHPTSSYSNTQPVAIPRDAVVEFTASASGENGIIKYLHTDSTEIIVLSVRETFDQLLHLVCTGTPAKWYKINDNELAPL